MSKVDDGGPAFPCDFNMATFLHDYKGLTIRDYFAGQAMAFFGRANIGGWSGDMSPEHAASATKHCFIIADAMLAARAEAPR